MNNFPKYIKEEAEKNHKEGWKQTKRGKKSNPTHANNNPGKWQEKTQEQPTKNKGASTSNQFDSLQTEEGEIPDLENQTKEESIEFIRTQSHASLSLVAVEEITVKSPNGSASLGGT